jgi:gluconolactonase
VEDEMQRKVFVSMAIVVLGVAVAFGQAPAPRQGPGVQAAQDARYPSVIAQCKTPPPAPAAAPAGGRQGGATPPSAAAPRETAVTAIPVVIAAGQQWTRVWETKGNNGDGIVGTEDGGLLIASNDNSEVVKLDPTGKASVVYKDTNTGGALSFNKKGELFIVERALNPAIWQLAPQRRLLANKYQGDTLDCLGGVLNDLTADSRGGVYFTMGGLYYADPKGVVTKYGDNLRTNGVILSPDEKTLYVTNTGSVAAFEVKGDGSLTNQREFVTLPGGGGDGMTVDGEGRLYVTGGPGVHVIAADGKYLGVIPTPPGVISAAFSGRDKKTLYAVISLRVGETRDANIISIPMLAQGYKGRAK